LKGEEMKTVRFKASKAIGVYKGNGLHMIDGQSMELPDDIADRLAHNLPDHFCIIEETKMIKPEEMENKSMATKPKGKGKGKGKGK